MGGENWVLNLGLLENGAAGPETPALSQDPGRGFWVKNNDDDGYNKIFLC